MSKVVVGMSGGVDSSVAALLLKEKGYEVIGVTMNIWGAEDAHPEAVADAGCVADILGIDHWVIDCRSVFEKKIITYFADTYKEGKTPNPCVFCNRLVKWETLLAAADTVGAEYVATGHYASVIKLPNSRFTLKNSPYGKDQTYALYRLTQEQLSRTLMPLGDYSKDKIRQIAADASIPVAGKPDSQDICFVPDGDYARFLEEKMGIKSEPGNFVLEDGTIAGRHNGLIHYTVGQRRGLGISAPESLYVLRIVPEKNEIVLGYKKDTATSLVYANRLNIMAEKKIKEKKALRGKIRYNHRGGACTATQTAEDTIECLFEEPVFGVAPGQALVLYDGDTVFGGGIIVGGDGNENGCTCTL